jgi:hypothetical protein
MKQEAAQATIEKAGQHPAITATLDTARAGRYKDGPGFRVRLEHRRARRVLFIDSLEQWESVLQAWQEL